MTESLPPENPPKLAHYDIRVLLIDDQPIVGETIKRMLAPEKDIIFHYCSDPAKAMATAIELGPTILLQDLVMPDIDGLTLVKFYRAHPKLRDVPLIVLSSKEEATTKAEAFALGANDYLVKLPDRIELVARIRYHSQGYINLLERNDAYAALLKSQEALAHELSQASEYVRSLIPPRITEGNPQTQWTYEPSSQLGGDFFGYHWVDPDHFAMYLLDVCGHGVGPALLAVSAINMVSMSMLADVDFLDPEQVLGSLNATFQMDRNNGLFFTFWYGVYDKRTSIMKYCSAGHHPALLINDKDEVTEVYNKNLVIGCMPDVQYKGATITIPPKSRLYVFSDGIFEISRPDGSMWEEIKLHEYFQNPPEGGCDVDTLYSYVLKMHGEKSLDDDFSLMKILFS